MALLSSTLLPDKDDYLRVHDEYKISAGQIVVLSQAVKGTVVGMLSGSFSLDVQSQWDELLKSQGNMGKVVGFADYATQTLAGNTLRQPFFGRAIWKGTSPISFEIPMIFSTWADAKTDVYEPMIKLLSYLYPRINKDTSDDGDDGTLLSTYFVPGPTILSTEADDPSGRHGDVVRVRIGVSSNNKSFIDFKKCYIKGLNINVANNFDDNGYPNKIDVRVQISAFQGLYVNKDGSFLTEGIGSNATSADALLTKCSNLNDTIQDFFEGLGGKEK